MPFPSCQAFGKEPPGRGGPRIPRIRLLPKLECCHCLVRLSRPDPVVACFDREPLPLAHLLPQLVSLADVLGRPLRLMLVAVHVRHVRIGDGEIRIELHRSLEEGQGCTLPSFGLLLLSQAINL
jgi:hypothetical protein